MYWLYNSVLFAKIYDLTSGQIVPNRSPQNMARVVYPPSPHIVQNSRELSVKGAQHRRFCGGLPLTGGTGCSISRRRGGGISSRAASFPMTGKGRGIGLNINGGLLMNFTNSPYERMMKEIPHPETPAPQKAPEGTPCAGCPYWKGIGCLFCYREHLKKAGLMCGHLARKNALFARVSSLGF